MLIDIMLTNALAYAAVAAWADGAWEIAVCEAAMWAVHLLACGAAVHRATLRDGGL